jgi:hypothetical protein
MSSTYSMCGAALCIMCMFTVVHGRISICDVYFCNLELCKKLVKDAKI